MKRTGNDRKLYAYRFFSSLVPAYVIERLYWEQRGMSIQEVIYAEIIYALTIVLLEVPSGVMADKWGRKRMLVLGAALGCAEFLLLIFANEFWHFALVVFLAGISRSASSGAENALLYDSLQLEGKASLFEQRLGRLNACDFVSAMLAALCGSLLASRFELELNYWLSLGSALAAALVSLSLIEPGKVSGDNEAEEETIPFKQYVTMSLRFFRTNPGVRLVVMTAMITGAAISYIDEFWQIYVDRLGMPVAYFGVLSAAMMLLRLPGNLLAHALLGRFRYRTLLFGVTAICAIGFACAALGHNYFGLASLLIICLCSGIVDPLAAGYLHRRTDSAMRATIDSFRSLGENAVHIAAGLGFGWFSARYDVFGGYGFLSLLCGAFLLWFAFASRSIAEHKKNALRRP